MRRLAAREGSQPVHHPAGFAGCGFGLREAATEELRGIHRHAFDRQLGERVQELHQSGPGGTPVAIDLNEASVLAFENLA